jgi:hypothetical protein
MSFEKLLRSAVLIYAATLAFVFAPAPASAAETIYLIRNDVFCSTSNSICIRGTLSYEVNPRLLRLNGRVQRATGPGVLLIYLSGANKRGHRRIAEMEIRVRGHYSEIIDFKVIPDHPDVSTWSIDSILFDE